MKKKPHHAAAKKRPSRFLGKKYLQSLYVPFAICVLVSTCLVWSILGAQLQSGNADQLINSYLFQDLSTFHGALFPAAHTFLIKWPLFLLLRLCGHAALCLMVLTVGVCLATVAGLVYVLYRIDRRPQVFGSLVLALSGVLLLVPTQPYSGGLLPVGFAMLSTRNIEYVVYIVCLILLIRSTSMRTWRFAGTTALLALLFASDQLFLSISLGGAVSMLAVYTLLRRWQFVRKALRWLVAGIIAGGVATGVLWAVNITGLVHIIGQDSHGPYGFIDTLKQLGLGIIFAVLGVVTNFGANPVFDIGIVQDIPRVLIGRLLRPVTAAYIANFILLGAGIFASIRVFADSMIRIKKTRRATLPPNTATTLTLFLVWSSLTAIAVFIVTNHYYAVDARYLTITLFTLFIALATFLRSYRLPPLVVKRVILIVLLVGIGAGVLGSFDIYQQQLVALNPINQRNKKIALALDNHRTDLLVGDYWRVMPIIQQTSQPITSMPLTDCTTPRMVLTSTKWQPSLINHRFAYLLSLDKSLTDYPQCTIDQVIEGYGHPNASTVIDGTNEHPTELLLFYDKGIGKDQYRPRNPASKPTILPVALPPTVKTDCADNITVMNIIAHQDDDLLFMNPDLSHHIIAGHCVRTVYVTAGDAGQDSQYWLGREKGAETAYASLMGADKDALWIQKTIKLADHQFITTATLQGNSRVTLLFMRLTDGNIDGKGFKASKKQSIAGLIAGRLAVIHAADGQSSYSSGDLTHAISSLMDVYLPTEINTQATHDFGRIFHDHSDHIVVGQYAQRAYEIYSKSHPVPIHYYIGYPIREKPENVMGEDLIHKIDVFTMYGQFDGGVCHLSECDRIPTYQGYLRRQYTTEQWTAHG